ncbi:cupin domain-containing protein [uncultured Shewanella sp.]|uniref:cupin domain-containing protein n=1 Tax=uncultured Shewanella sp. TaxID=173975 RepID=UPI002620E3C7|nr:cupin domain-containing protein [uncultured Shewanella sp.]
MEYIELISHNGLSSFITRQSKGNIKKELGLYSIPYSVSTLEFRDFEAGHYFDWHPAPQAQFIFYLEGQVEITASDGTRKTFKAGDILFANDTQGKGHITHTLSQGRAIIVAIDQAQTQ